ncbi:MAG: SpoIIE family protein phosphatase [Calditrichaeota bacterium]|nr:SpoIIE family protein phosphatase [Calditrichota bacterium]
MHESELARLRKRAQNLSTLVEVSAIINSTLDLNEVVRLVMEKAQEVMNAEASSVLLLNPETNRLEVQSALGQVGDKVKETVSLEVGQGIAGWVAQTGKPLNVPDVSKDPRFFGQVDQMTGFRTRSILAAPLEVKGGIIGVAEVINRRDGQPFDDEDLELFTAFCRGVALAIENARMHKAMLERERLMQQLEAAKVIQESFLPRHLPVCPRHRYEVAAYYEPARAIGGDLYDFVRLDEDRLGIVFGDVSGKGVPAALFMARLISDLHFHAKSGVTPDLTVKRVNEQLVERSQRGMFVTLVYAILNAATGEFTFANAGHLPLLRVQNRTGKVETISEPVGIPLGVRAEADYKLGKLQLEHGDLVVLLTDGVTEARDPERRLFTLPNLIRELEGHWDTPQRLVDHVLSLLGRFRRGSQQTDDITLVALKWC